MRYLYSYRKLLRRVMCLRQLRVIHFDDDCTTADLATGRTVGVHIGQPRIN
jgi:hypothetical protein